MEKTIKFSINNDVKINVKESFLKSLGEEKSVTTIHEALIRATGNKNAILPDEIKEVIKQITVEQNVTENKQDVN